MTLSDFQDMMLIGRLVRQIIKEEWPVRLGDFRAVDERCDKLAKTAPWEWEGQAVKLLLYRASLIIYDKDSGLWYCAIVAPKQDYPEGWESDAKIERKKRLAEREAWGQVKTPRPKAKRKKKSATRPPFDGLEMP